MLWATGCVLCLVAVVRCAAVCEGLFALFSFGFGRWVVGVVGGHLSIFWEKGDGDGARGEGALTPVDTRWFMNMNI